MLPIVSVVMPCKNDGKYIEEAVASVIGQTYPLIELIIVDDKSDDSFTVNILNKLRKTGICVIQGRGIGPAAARNDAIKAANGDYILPLDSDDLIDKTYIQKAVKCMDSDQNLGIVYCKAMKFGQVNCKWDLPVYSFEKMLVDNIIFVSAMFRKKDWLRYKFDETLIYGMEDYDFWLSIIEEKRAVYQISEELFFYRIKENSRTSRFITNKDNVLETYEKIYSNHLVLYRENYDIFAYSIRKTLIEQLNKNVAMERFYKKIKTIPGFKLIKRLAQVFIK